MAYVYRHIRLDKNEVFYIGIGVGYRYNQKHNRNRYWKHVVGLAGFHAEIIIDDLTWEQAIEKEKEFIRLYGRKDLGKGTLVNLTDGGEGMLGHKPTIETRKKSSELRRGKCPRPPGWKQTEEGRRKMSSANKGNKRCVGRVLSIATKNKISASLMGNEPVNRIPVVQYSIKGEFVSEHASADMAGRLMGAVHGGSITKNCKRRNGAKTAHGYRWFYKSDVLDDNGNPLINVPPIPTRLTDEQIRFIRNSELSNAKLGKIFSVSSTTIFYIKKNQTNNGDNSF